MTDELHPVQILSRTEQSTGRPCGSNWLFVASVDLSRPSIAALICSAWVRAEEGRPTVAYIVNPEDPT